MDEVFVDDIHMKRETETERERERERERGVDRESWDG